MASKRAFAVACIKLYARLWAELDGVLEVEERGLPHLATPGALERIEILRLEIHLLINACERARWRMLLTAPQRHSLKSTLKSVLLALHTDTEPISGAAIAAAQNRLFDAVHAQSALSLRARPFEPTRRLGS